MTVSTARSIKLRGISLFVAIAFTATTLMGSPSLATASSGAFEGLSGLKAVSGIQKDLYAMPPELGSLVSLWEPNFGERGTGNGERPNETVKRLPLAVSRHDSFVVLIQDAHANPGGQQNIAAMLHYLEQKSPGLVIGLEGASGELHPEYLDFFQEYPEANRAAVEDLKKKGELNGAERYLLEQFRATHHAPRTTEKLNESKPVDRGSWTNVRGIEDAGLYSADLRLYRDLLAVRGEIERSLLPLRTAIEKESSRKLSGELRDFLKERSRRKEGRFDLASSATDADLQAYVQSLEKQTLKTLAIDLKDPLEQLRFPNLIRVVKIQDVRQAYDPKSVQAQWGSVVSTLNKAAKDPAEKEFAKAFAAFGRRMGFLSKKENDRADVSPSAPALYPRQLVEAFFRFSQKHQLSFTGQEAFWQSWKLAVFQAEIDVTGWLNEMDRLEGLLIEKLTRSEDEKALVQKLSHFDLLGKMFRLELSRKEYDKALSERQTLEALVKDSKPLVPSLANAYEFYKVSLARDEALVENTLALFSSPRSSSSVSRGSWPVPRLAVLYSGGFHTPGIEEILRQKGIGYAVLSPRMTSVDHGEMYQKAMDGDNADLSAYFKVKNPFLTKQEALLFKQLIETASPVLSEKYKLSPDQVAVRVSQAVQEHPVLSEVVLADQKGLTNAATVRFRSRPDLQALIPQISSAMPRANLSSPVEARSDVRANDLHPEFVSNVSFSSAQAPRLDSASMGSAVSVRSEARKGSSAANALAEELEKVAEGKITPSEKDWLSIEAKIERSLGLNRESARFVMESVMQPLIPVASKEKIDRLFDPDFIPGTFMVGERLKNPKFLSVGDNANLRKWVNAQIVSELARWKHQFENEENAADRARYEKMFTLIQAKENEWGMSIGDAVFMLFFLKTTKGARFVDTIPNQIYQDVLARSISMLVSGSPYNNPFADKGFNEKLGKVMEEILPRLAGLSLDELFRYSIASGAMGLDLKSNASAASIINVNNIIPYYAEGETDAARPSRMFDQLKLKAARPLAIDFWPEFEEQFVRAKTAKTILFFHDDYGETQIDLLFIQKLLEENPKLTVISVPRSGPPGPSGYLRFGNDASSMDFPEFLSRDVFRSLARQQKNGHYQFSSKGPTWGAVSGKEFSEEVADLVLKSDAIVVKGARSYEMLQGINKDAYFAYMVCREFSESVTGVDSNTGLSVFIKQEAGLPSFQGFRERNTRVRELFDTGRKGWTTPMTAADYAEAVHSKTYREIVQRFKDDKLSADRWIKNRSAESGVTFSEWILSQGRSEIRGTQDQTAVWREELEKELQSHFAHEVNPVAERIVQERRLPSGGDVLSLGSGRGRDEIFFAKNGYHVTATDFIPEALTVIRDSAAREGVSPFLETKLQDLTQSLAFEDDSFDMVYAHLSLHYFDDPSLKAIISEIFRVLKPGGKVALTVRSVEDWKFQDALNGRSRGKVLAGDFLDTDGKKQRFFTERSLGDLWKGFESVSIEKKPFQRLVGQPVSTVLELFATKPVVLPEARSEVRGKDEVPEIGFLRPETARLATNFMKQAVRQKTVDPVTGQPADLSKVAKDVDDLIQVLLVKSAEQLKEICRQILEGKEAILVSGTRGRTHDLTGFKGMITKGASEVLVRNYAVYRPGGYRNTDPIVGITDILAEMYLKKRIGHRTPAEYLAFQPQPSLSEVPPSNVVRPESPEKGKKFRSELRKGAENAALFGIGNWLRNLLTGRSAQTSRSERSLQLPLDPKMRLRLIEQMREQRLITGAIIPEVSSKIWDSFFEDFEVFLGQISKLNFTRPIKTILIAEDEDGYQREHRRAFEKLGRSDLEIIYTHDGIEAFEYMKAHPGIVDLILTDVDMPTLDYREREAMIANGYSVNDVNGDRFMMKARTLLHEEIPAVFITGRDLRKVPLAELGNAILLSKTRFTAPVFVLALRAMLEQSKNTSVSSKAKSGVVTAMSSEIRVSLAMLRAMHREANPGTESAYWAEVGKFHDRFRETGVDTESIDDPRAKELSKFTVYPEMRSLYLQRIRALLSRLPEGMNDQPRQVISIGLGDGSFEKALMDQLGMNVAGFELSPVLADRAREKGIQVFGKPGEPGEPAETGMGKLADASQDVVLINEAMGYLDPVRIFQEAFRVLRPGGIVLILQYPVTAKNAGTVSQTGYVYYPFEDFALEQGKVLEGLATGLKAAGFSESGTDSLLTRDLPKDSKFIGFFPNRQRVMDFHWAQKPFNSRLAVRSEVRERWTTKGKVSRSLTVLGRVAFLPKDTHDFQWSVTPEGMKEAQEEFLLWLKQIHSGMETLLVPILARHLKDFIRAKAAAVQSSQAKDAALPGTMTIHPVAALLAALQDGISKGEVPRLKGKEDEKKILNDYFSDTARLLRIQSLIAASSKDPVAGEALLEKQFEVARLVIERNMAEQEEALHGIQNRLMLMDSTVVSLDASRKAIDQEELKEVPDHDLMSRLQKEIDRCVLILGEQLDPKSGKRVNTKKLDLEATLDRIESYIHMLKNELLPKVQDSKGSSHRAKMEGGAQTLATLFFYPKALFFFGFFKKVDQTTDFGRNSAQGYFDTAMFVRDIVVAQVEAIERELLSGSPTEEISERGLSDGNIKGLLVRRNASTGEIMRALELLGKELGFLVASKVSQNAHWVQIVRGRSFAPPILFLSEVEDKDNLDKLVEGQEILLKGDDQSGEGELVASPHEKDLKDAEIRRQNERYLSEGEKRLAEYPLDTKVGINMSTGDELGNPASSGAVNSSLIRTDILAEKTKKHIAEVMAAIASGEFNVSGWLTLLRDLKISNLRSQEDVKLLLGQFILVLQKNGMPSIRGLLGNLRSVYGPFIRHPFFEGNYEPFRTLDLQNDSKNKDVLALLEDIHAKHPEAGLMRYPEGHNPQSKSKKWITGFNFYKNSSLGQFLLIWQLTALLIEYTHYLEAGGVADPARLAPLFPMVATPEDLDFIKTQILPFAQKLAALNLRTDVQWSPESLKKAEQQVERAARKVSYGMMLEVMPILENPVLMDQMIERPDVEFYDVGTNDLEKELWEEEVRKILKALGKSTDEDLENFELPREVEEAQHLYGSLHPRLMRGLDTFARKLAVYNAKHPGKEKRMCICGQLGGSLKFLSMVERWRRMGVPVSVSVGFEEVRQVRHTFLRYRQVPKEVLDYVASDPELIDLRAGELSSAMMRQSMDFLKTSEEFQTRYARLGYYHGFYQDSMDPENGVGSFRDIMTIKKLFRSLVHPEDRHSLALSPEEDVSDAELTRILAYLEKKDPFLGRDNRPFADAQTLGSLRAAARFLRDAREVFREVHQITVENQDLPEKKEIVLHTGNLSEFINAFEKRFPRESQPWLSKSGEAKRQEEFFSRYYDAANVVFTQVTGMMHEGFEHLFGAETEELGLVTEFRSEVREPGKEEAPAKVAIPLLIWKRLGMVFKREIGFVYREIRELYIPEIFEKAALAYFVKDPAAMLEVFKHAIADRRSREIRIAYALQRVLRQATALASSEGDLKKVAKGFREFFRSRHDISYSLWRLHRFGFFSKFFPSYAAMRNYFPGDGRKSPVHIQTLNAMEFLERLGDAQDFAFVRAGNVFKEIRKDHDGLMLLRLTLFMLGIVRARLKLKTGDVPNSGEIRAILEEVLVEKMDFGLSNDQLERMTWLISKERQLNGNEMITSREIVAALKRIFFEAGENVPQGQLDMLYLLTFSMRAGRVDHEKLVMLKRQGPDSALANCDKFYVAGRAILRLRLTEGNLKALVRDTQEVVRRGLWGSDRPLSILADENSNTGPSIKRKFNEAWGDFKELSPQIFDSHRRTLSLQEDEAGLLKLSLEELHGDSGKFLELFKRYEEMVSPYYLESLDRKTLVSQLVFFAHLQQLQNREDSEPIVLFSALAHHYSNAFEISIGRALEDPGLIALYSRILFQHGFLIESTTVQREAGAGGKYVVRFMGSLPHGVSDANKVIEKIVKDFEAIFYIPGKHPYTSAMSLREKLVRRFYFYVRPFLAKHLRVKDRAITAGFFRNAYERFGDFTVRQEPSVGAVASTTLDFLPQLSDRDSSRLVIRTRDRRGLIAFVATYISQIQKLDIVDFYFDDTMGRNPRMILDIAQKDKKGILTDRQKGTIVSELKEKLDAFEVGIHRMQIFNLYELTTVGEKPLVPSISQRAPASGAPEIPVAQPVLPETPQKAEIPSAPEKEVTSVPVASADSLRVRSYKIATPYGLHNLPSALVARSFKKHPKILGGTMTHLPSGTSVSMKEQFALMTLGAEQGHELKVELDLAPEATPEEVEAFWTYLETEIKDPEKPDADSSASKIPIFKRQEVRSELRRRDEKVPAGLESREYTVTGIYGVHIRSSKQIRRIAELFKPLIVSAKIQNLTNFPGRDHSLFDDNELRIAEMYPGNLVKVDVVFNRTVPDAEKEIGKFWQMLEAVPEPEGDTPANRLVFSRARSETREAEASERRHLLEHHYKVTGKFGLHIGPSKRLFKTFETFSDLLKSAELHYSGFHVDLMADDLLPIFELQIPNGGMVKIVIVPKENRTEDTARIEELWRAIESVLEEKNNPLFTRWERPVPQPSIAPVKASSEPVGILASRQYRLMEDIGPKYATRMAGVAHRYHPAIVNAFFEMDGYTPANLTRELEVLTLDARQGKVVEIRVVFKRETPDDKIREFWDLLERLPSTNQETGQSLLSRVPDESPKRVLPEAPVLDLEQFVLRVAMKWVEGKIAYTGKRSPEYGNATPTIVAADLLRSDIQLYLLRGKKSPLVEELQRDLKLAEDPEAQKKRLRELQSLLEKNIREYDLSRLLAGIESMVPSTVSQEGDVVSGKISDLPVTLVINRANVSRKTVGMHTTSSIEINENAGGTTKLRHLFIGVDCDFLNRTLEGVLLKRVSSRVSEPSPADVLVQVSGSTAELASEVEKAFKRSEIRNLVEKWVPRAEALKAAAKELGVYSEAGIAFAIRDPRKARLWIALKIVEEMRSGESRLENSNLQSILTKVFASFQGLRNVADRNVAGVDFHANFSGLSDSQWSELARNFPLVLALLVSLHARLSINVDIPERELEPIRKKFEVLLKKEGISMDSKQFRFVSSFKKTPFESFKSGKADALFARDRELVKSHNRNVATRWFETSTDMKQLAAGLATALLYVASDKKPDSLEPLEPSKYEAVLKAVVSAIAGYALIQKAA